MDKVEKPGSSEDSLEKALKAEDPGSSEDSLEEIMKKEAKKDAAETPKPEAANESEAEELKQSLMEGEAGDHEAPGKGDDSRTEEKSADEENTAKQAETAMEDASSDDRKQDNSGQAKRDDAPEDLYQAEDADLNEGSKAPRKKLSGKSKIIIASVGAAVFVILLIGYIITGSYYSKHFLMNTTVNGMDCAGKTVKDVEKMIQEHVEEYELTITGREDYKQTIPGEDIGIKYIGYKQLKEAFDKQNPYLWPRALFKPDHIKVEILFDYSQEKADAAIAALECMKEESQIPPVAATVVYKDEAFEIQPESIGKQIDSAKFTEAVNNCIKSIDYNLDIDEAGCYVAPRFTKSSPEVKKARDEMNGYLNAEITYSLDGVETKLTKTDFASWISVDENMTPVISAGQARAYATGTLAKAYNTPNKAGVFTSLATGKVAPDPFPNATLGRQVGYDAERDEIVNTIKEGRQVSREPVIARQAMPEGQYVWGNTYIEVDLTEQHMWYVANGVVAMDSPVVTGSEKPARQTPAGLFTVLEMKNGKYLTGYLPNGKLEYRTWVNYWMRVTWGGVGFHDLSHSSKYAYNEDDLEKHKNYHIYNGSHGCINMPKDKARQLYGLVSVGTQIVIHH